jgi:IS4 transposase
MDTLAKIFGDAAKVKLMRLFLFNPTIAFDVEMISKRARLDVKDIRHRMTLFEKMDLVKKRVVTHDVEEKKKDKVSTKKVRNPGWILNENFEYLYPLQNLLINISPLKNEELLKRLSGVGRLKLVVVAGVFIQEWESRVDLLVAGDKINTPALEKIIKTIESEIGKEIKYSAFETEDFHYRHGMYDKLIRDI